MINKNQHIIVTIFFSCLLYLCGISHISQAMTNSFGDFPTAAPEKNGFFRQSLEGSVSKIGTMTGVYGVIVIRNGYLTVEKYFRGGAQDKPHNLKSSSKSVLSALAGIAIDKGYLRLDQPISDFLPFIKNLDDPRKNKITVRHLLTMKSGLQSMSYQAYNSWVLNGDWLTKLLQLPIVSEPGTKHQYSTGDTHILSAVLTAATGMSTKEFAEKYLFGPMNIPIKGWQVDPQGIYQGGNNLSIYPMDMAKFGQLYLNGGQFEAKQIVPNWWVTESTRMIQQATHPLYGGYGYLWYSQPRGEDAFVAVGYGGQYIYISPKDQTVIVIISTLKSKGEKWESLLFDQIQHGILTSISDKNQPKVPLKRGIATTTLNLRKGPGKNFPIITTIDPGSILKILAKKGTWLQIHAHSQQGWVASRYVNMVNPEKLAIVNKISQELQKSLPEPVPHKVPQVELTLSQYRSSLERLKKSDAETSVILKEYESKQNRLAADISKNKQTLPAIKNQINNLMESDLKTVTTYGQLRGRLDEIRLGLDQIMSRYTALTEGVKSLQKNDNAARFKDLTTSLKQYRREQGQINNELATIHGQVTSKNTLAIKTANDHQNQISGLSKEIPAIKKQLNDLTAVNDKTAASFTQLQEQLTPLHLSFKKIVDRLHTLSELSSTMNKEIAKINTTERSHETVNAESFSRLDNVQNEFSKKLSQSNITLKHNSDELNNLGLNVKQLRLEDGDINNKIVSMQDTLAKDTAILSQDLDAHRQETSKIKFNLQDIQKIVIEKQNSFQNQLKQQRAANTEGQRVQAQTITEVQIKIDQERLGKDQLASEIDALKISFASLRSENHRLRENFHAYEKKTKNIDIKVLYLADELGKLQHESEESKIARADYEDKMADRQAKHTLLSAKDHTNPTVIGNQNELTAAIKMPAKQAFPSMDRGKAEHIIPFITSWSTAWSQKNVVDYLSHYSDSFVPSKGMNLQKWQAKRTKNIEKPKFIRITVSQLQQKMLTTTQAKVIFHQSYSSDTFSDQVVKTLFLQWQENTWKIISEKSK